MSQQIRLSPPYHRSLFAGCALLLFALSESPLLAASESEEILRLPEIEVGAERPEEAEVTTSGSVTPLEAPLKELPMTINTVPTETLEERGGTRVEDLSFFVPGVAPVTQSGNANDALLIRGFEQFSTTINGVRRYGFRETWNALANIERIEILKGPGGVESGVVEPGGYFNLVTKKPQETAAQRYRLDYGSYQRVYAEADLTGPLSEDGKLLYRLIGSADRGESFRDNYEPEQYLLAPSLEYRYGRGGSVLLELAAQYSDAPYDRGIAYLEGAGLENDFFPIHWSKHEPDDSLKSENYRTALYWRHPFTEIFSLRTAAEWQRSYYVSKGARNPNLNGLYQGGPNNSLLYSGNPIVRRTFARFDGELVDMALQVELHAVFETGAVAHQSVVGAARQRWRSRITGQDGQTTWDLNAFDPQYGTEPTVIGTAEEGIGRDFVSDGENDYRSLFAQHKLDWRHWHLVAGLRYDDADFSDTYTNNIHTDPPGIPDTYSDNIGPTASAPSTT